MNDINQELISVPEAARRAGVHRDTIRRAAQSGIIKAIKPGRNWVIYASDLERWKQQHYSPDKAHRYPPQDDGNDEAED